MKFKLTKAPLPLKLIGIKFNNPKRICKVSGKKAITWRVI